MERILELVRGTVSDARRIIANLRPTTLDDLGLAATISLEVERLREEGYRVEYADDIGEERLPGAPWQREKICHLADAQNSFLGIC